MIMKQIGICILRLKGYTSSVDVTREITSWSSCSVGLCMSQCTNEVQASGSPQSQQPPPPLANNWSDNHRERGRGRGKISGREGIISESVYNHT